MRRLGIAAYLCLGFSLVACAQAAKDPGVRPGAAGAGGIIGGLTSDQQAELPDFAAAFNRVNTVQITPVFAAEASARALTRHSCASCHAQCVAGGSSPASNPGSVLNARFPYQSDLVTPDG